MRRLALLLLGTLALGGLHGCSEHSEETTVSGASDESLENPVTVENTVGPVTATVSLAPREPMIGDQVVLVVEVSSEPGVDVEMPGFGDQLGRFGIVDFSPKTETEAVTGRTVSRQRYTLDLPGSGRQRVPSLLVEFIDRRHGPSDELRELLTDEIVIEVGSYADPKVDTLRPAREPLPELEPELVDSQTNNWLLVLILGAAGLGLLVTLLLVRSRGPRVDPRTAGEIALESIGRLEAEGVPAPQRVDGWWVELSDIVRRYLEGHFGLRAPELTTEEFLRAAQDSEQLLPDQRTVLRRLLSDADRVKFAGHVPGDEESRDALRSARRFVEDAVARESSEGGV